MISNRSRDDLDGARCASSPGSEHAVILTAELVLHLHRHRHSLRIDTQRWDPVVVPPWQCYGSSGPKLADMRMF